MRHLRTVVGIATLVLGAATVLLHTVSAQAGTRPNTPTTGSPAGIGAQACQQQSFLEGEHLSDVEIARLARGAGFSGEDWVISVAVAKAESSGWTRARLINTDCSVDRGLWQINSFWHGEVSDSCAFTPSCAAQGTRTIWASGGWGQWVTFTNGAYQAHMSAARAAVNQAGGGGGGGGGCNHPNWVAGKWYVTGSIVRYTDGRYYIAEHDNPGYDPVISTWYWDPYTCG